MGFLDMQFGEDRPSPTDRRALERYRYLLRTAPPEAIEQAHAEAFSQLTPEQRGEVLRRLGQDLPSAELPTKSDVQSLARAATRAELRRPGMVEKSLGAASVGQMFGSSLLGTVVGSFVASAVAEQFLGGFESWSEANRLKEGLTLTGNDEELDDDEEEDEDDSSLGETEPD
jgi:hypothetical protein